MNKKTLIKAICIFIICISITIALTFAINTGFQHEEPLVYVTRTGEKYHSRDCGYLRSSIPRGLEEARKAGYTACSRCGGKANGTITVNNFGASFGISLLIICAVTFLGFVIYNKIGSSSPVQNDKSIPTNNATPSKPTNAMVQCGDIVIHKSFGKGKITKLSQNYITIQFTDKERVFGFPNAFTDGFLRKENAN